MAIGSVLERNEVWGMDYFQFATLMGRTNDDIFVEGDLTWRVVTIEMSPCDAFLYKAEVILIEDAS